MNVGSIIPAGRYEADPSWRSHAACAGMAAEVFFPSDQDYDEAAGVCASCRVREECMRYAMTNREDGMWGGLTPDDRRRLRRQSGRAKLRTCQRAACRRTFFAVAQESYCSSSCETAERSRRAAERQRMMDEPITLRQEGVR